MWTQWWARDSGVASPNNASLPDAATRTIGS